MKYEIKVTKTTAPKPHPTDETKLGFGQIFTDHMFLMDFDPDKGWHDARIVPFGPLPIHPAATVFHYGVEIFEGLKAYRRADGAVALFRPDENAKRFRNSAERLCLPELDEEAFVDIVKTLVELEKDWIPSAEGTSLYIRPFMFGDDANLGVHGVHHAVFAVICSPVGAYYAGDYFTMLDAEADDVDLRFYYPERTNYFIDAMCIPSCCQNKELAEIFINYMLSAEPAIANAEYIYYASPNSLVYEDEGYIEEMGEDTMAILYPEIDFNAMYGAYAYRSLDADMLDYVNTLWETLKIN